ncbi:MAG: outer membrane beta-barrel protein [Hyphomicrobium sp.]|uniref:hypothetical protein n=1 Tax=Hyphomicrobium sp. TaxID=82 RepID=UPI003D0E2438
MKDLGGPPSRFRRAGLAGLCALFAWPTEAAADRIGGSSIPASAPSLKGRISEDDAATSVVVMTASVGATDNAGPTLLETPSPFLERGFGYATFSETVFGRLDFSINLSDRIYTDFRQADERAAISSLTLTKDWAGQQTIVALAFSGSRDVEERLTETSLSVIHGWTTGTIKPYIKVEAAWLDYSDIPDSFQPFANQDDRDRISSRGEMGLRLTLTEHVELQVGAGIDHKAYLTPNDDFGVRRGSVSPYPLIGIAYAGERGSLKALYMPFWRDYREDLFRDAWKHGYAVEGEFKLTDTLKAFVSARYGFEETDFVIASSAYEAVLLGGLALTVGKGSVSLAVSRTERSYDDLELAGIARADDKVEVAFTGEMPLVANVSLTGRVSYLDYESTFGEVETDALVASLGLTYAATH